MKMVELNEKKVSIIIDVSLFVIGFDVFYIDSEAFLLFSCFRFAIGRLAFNHTKDTLKIASKSRC